MSFNGGNIWDAIPKELLERLNAARTEVPMNRPRSVSAPVTLESVGLSIEGAPTLFSSYSSSNITFNSTFVVEEPASSPQTSHSSYGDSPALPEDGAVEASGMELSFSQESVPSPLGRRKLSGPPSYSLPTSELKKLQLQLTGGMRDDTVPISMDEEESPTRSTNEIFGEIMFKNDQEEYFDIGPYVTLPQHEASIRLGIPSSSLSKKWKDATINRPWPYRNILKLDKQINMLMRNINTGTNPNAEREVQELLLQRQQEMRSVLIRR